MKLNKFKFNAENNKLSIKLSKKQVNSFMKTLGNSLGLENGNLDLSKFSVTIMNGTEYDKMKFVTFENEPIDDAPHRMKFLIANLDEKVIPDTPIKSLALWDRFMIPMKSHETLHGLVVPGNKDGDLKFVTFEGKSIIKEIPKDEHPEFRGVGGHINYNKVLVTFLKA